MKKEPPAPAPAAGPVTANPQVITGSDGAPMVLVPAGVFTMGADYGKPPSRPHMNVFIEAYYMDRFEVSNERFEKFVEATNYAPKMGTRNKYMSPFSFRAGLELHPAQGLTWYDAKAYCEWAHERLPIEYEWEKAARGPDGRIFPWGNEKKAPGRSAGRIEFFTLPEYEEPAGQSPYGCLHMADNVWEWVDDWFNSYVLSDLKDPRFGKRFKVLRGGLITDRKEFGYSRTTDRYPLMPDERKDFTGARCVMDVGDGR